MGIPRFFVADIAPGVLMLPESEARHAARSRRLETGDSAVLFNGEGAEARAEIVRADRHAVEMLVREVVVRERARPGLVLVTATPKGPRQDWLIEKCTELGVAAIRPLLAGRGVVAPGEHRLDRWRRLSIEAAKQSQQAWLPELHAPQKLEEVLQAVAAERRLVLCAAGDIEAIRGDPENGIVPIHEALEASRAAPRVAGFIGPEGGWTEAELESLLSAGAEPVALGPHVLRIETAAVALAAMVHGLQGR